MSVINYFFEKHVERCKKELKDFETSRFKDVREDLRVETRKYLEEINNFLSSINAESYTDFEGFNNKIKTFNDELNRIMKASANISTLVYVIQNVSEDDFYTYTDFISCFAYDENKFNNADERDIKNLKRLDKFLERADDDFELYKERGDLKAELGLYNEAIDDYKKAIELNSNYEEAKQALKITENNLDIHNFINDNSLIENDFGKDSEYYFDKAYNFADEGKYKEAIVYYSKVIELDPDYSAAYNNRGLTKYYLRQYEEAIKDYNEAIELDPNNSLAYNNRGVSKENLGQYKEAIKDFNKAIKLNPNNSLAYNNRGLAKYYLRQYEEAIKDYNEAIELDPNNSLAYNNRGVSKENSGRYEEAIKDFNKAIELDSNNSLYYRNRGLTKYYLRQYEEAIKDYNEAIELDPNDSYAYNNRGNVKKNLGEYNEALKDYKKALELDPNNNTAKNNIKKIQDKYGLK